MKFTLSWLKDYLDTQASVDEIAEKLTAIGLEIEQVTDPARQFDGFLVGYVAAAAQHPNADRLRVCQVDVGDGTMRNIVCGAPNARAGIKVAFAPIGAYIPGLDVTLKKAEIRGVPSEGMMCSESELCLSEEHDGIIELPEDAKIGAPLAQILGLDDPIFEIGLTPNRGDCAGVMGIARDLAATGIGTFKQPESKAVKGTFKSSISVKIEDERACPLFLGRMIKNVKNGESPEWLKRRLKAVGLRPISALVDITNYFSIGLCRPLHVFDADKIIGFQNTVSPNNPDQQNLAVDIKKEIQDDIVKKIYDNTPSEDVLGRTTTELIGRVPSVSDSYAYKGFGDIRFVEEPDFRNGLGTSEGDIVVRMAKQGEKLDALNEKTYALDETMIAICDQTGVLGLGGIMGGVSSACETGTKNLYIECAYFDPLTIAKTGQNLQINSDARYRFERGIDPVFTLEAMEMATQMVLDLCGGEASEVVVAGAVPSAAKAIDFDVAMTEKLTGVVLDEKDQIRILNALGFTTEKAGKIYHVTPPSWRHDIQGAADFVEEIVRIHGFDNIPSISVTREQIPELAGRIQPALPPEKKLEQSARRLLAGRGLQECVTWSFMPSSKASLFGDIPDGLRIANPISADMDVMRPSIVPHLLKAAADNSNRGYDNGAFFEIGPVFLTPELVKGQEPVITVLRSGQAVDKHWTNATTPKRAVDVMDIKADMMAVLNHYAPNLQPQLTQDAPSYYHPGKSAVLRLGKTMLGVFGEIHPAVLEAYDIDFPVVAMELYAQRLPGIGKQKGASKPLLRLNPLQPLTRDFAFIVAESTRADDVVRAALAVDKNLLSEAVIFDVYQGKGVEDGHKSLALSVTIQPQDKTLSDAEIEEISQKIIQTVTQKTGGQIRG